ncbi:MAG: ABC transporter ATP-binding protein [Gemmatimonadota bacterium]
MSPAGAGPPAVRLEDIHHRFAGSGGGVGSLDLEVSSGEVVAILGPNGSGKTTLLRLLSTQLTPQSGRLSLLGSPADPPTAALRRRIAFAADEAIHIDALTGEENLRFFQALRGMAGLGRPEAEAGTDWMHVFGLASVADRPVSEYSFGMCRKLLLAEALSARPRLLLLDEPSVGLDPDGVTALEEGVAACARDGGAVVLASNEIRETPFWAHRILFLHAGQVVASGAPEELVARFGGRTRVEIHLDSTNVTPGHLSQIRALEGVENVGVEGDRLEAESSMGSRLLPELIRYLVDAGLEVRTVHLRHPGLDDVFQALTGTRLQPALRPSEEGPVQGRPHPVPK